MRILTYSDLHLEFGSNWTLPPEVDGDILLRVVVTHNAPVVNPKTRYRKSPVMPAFNSLDMLEIIETHQPALWVYGHTHECDDQTLGKTRIVSNQLGYPERRGGFECRDFDAGGRPVDL